MLLPCHMTSLACLPDCAICNLQTASACPTQGFQVLSPPKDRNELKEHQSAHSCCCRGCQMPKPMAGRSLHLSLSPRALPRHLSQPTLPPRTLSKPLRSRPRLLRLPLIGRSPPPLHRRHLPLLTMAKLLPPRTRRSTGLALLPTALP